MLDKRVGSAAEAIAGLRDGATILLGGFGTPGYPARLMDAVVASGMGDLTVVSNNGGANGSGLIKLISTGRVRRLICSFPQTAGATEFQEA